MNHGWRELRIVGALVERAFRGTVSDRGRLVDLLLMPFSFLIMWGLLLQSNVIPRSVGLPLLIVNLIWSIAASVQMQGNRTMMFDLWAREFCELFRSGVSALSYLTALIIVGALSGIANLGVFLVVVPLLFDLHFTDLAPLITVFPIYFLAALGLMAIVGGLVLTLGQTYGFLSWTALQFLMILSAPYAPLESLPRWLGALCQISPFTFAFEFVRFGYSGTYAAGLLIALLYAAFGGAYFLYAFNEARRMGRLVNL
jgi:ABC-2 type transport system permease protein